MITRTAIPAITLILLVCAGCGQDENVATPIAGNQASTFTIRSCTRQAIPGTWLRPRQHDDLTIGGLYAPGRDGQDILGHSASGDATSLSECDVVIELTNPAAADKNVPLWRESGADVLIGTSGYTVARIDALRDAWTNLETLLGI